MGEQIAGHLARWVSSCGFALSAGLAVSFPSVLAPWSEPLSAVVVGSGSAMVVARIPSRSGTR
jgi:hypothetical protein